MRVAATSASASAACTAPRSQASVAVSTRADCASPVATGWQVGPEGASGGASGAALAGPAPASGASTSAKRAQSSVSIR